MAQLTERVSKCRYLTRGESLKPLRHPYHEHKCQGCKRNMPCQRAWSIGSRLVNFAVPIHKICWLGWEQSYPCPRCRARFKVVFLDRVSPEIVESIKKHANRRALLGRAFVQQNQAE